ncbi:MAG: hypothetical protein HY924_07150 [Elusimicrobia bacterium]|nr:hypothetical protein [Elusimicrobiota bacterium]
MSCPICLRPRSRQEIVAGYTLLKKEATSRKRRPFVIAACVLGVAAAGLGLRRLSEAGILDRAKVARLVAHVCDDTLDVLHLLAGRLDQVDLGPPVRPRRKPPAPEPSASKPAQAGPEHPVKPAEPVEPAPPAVFPGSRFLAEESAAHARETGATKAWVYAVRAPLQEVAEFYKKLLASGIVSESEGEEGYVAITSDLEVRVSPRVKGTALVVVQTYKSRVTLKEPGPKHIEDAFPDMPGSAASPYPAQPSPVRRESSQKKEWCSPFCLK